MTETTPEHKLGQFVLDNLRVAGGDECERLLQITSAAVQLGLGDHFDSNYPEEPWLAPRGEGCNPENLCDDCKDADMGSPDGSFCKGCDHDG